MKLVKQWVEGNIAFLPSFFGYNCSFGGTFQIDITKSSEKFSNPKKPPPEVIRFSYSFQFFARFCVLEFAITHELDIGFCCWTKFGMEIQAQITIKMLKQWIVRHIFLWSSHFASMENSRKKIRGWTFPSTYLKTPTTMSEYEILKIIPLQKYQKFSDPGTIQCVKNARNLQFLWQEKLFSLHVDNFQSSSCRNTEILRRKRQKLNPWQTSAERKENQIMMKTLEKSSKRRKRIIKSLLMENNKHLTNWVLGRHWGGGQS